MQNERRQSSKKMDYLVDYRKDYLRIKVRWLFDQADWRCIDICNLIAQELRQAGYRCTDAELPRQFDAVQVDGFDRDSGGFAENKGFVYAGNGKESCLMAWQRNDRDKVVNLDIALRQHGIEYKEVKIYDYRKDWQK